MRTLALKKSFWTRLHWATTQKCLFHSLWPWVSMASTAHTYVNYLFLWFLNSKSDLFYFQWYLATILIWQNIFYRILNSPNTESNIRHIPNINDSIFKDEPFAPTSFSTRTILQMDYKHTCNIPGKNCPRRAAICTYPHNLQRSRNNTGSFKMWALPWV